MQPIRRGTAIEYHEQECEFRLLGGLDFDPSVGQILLGETSTDDEGDDLKGQFSAFNPFLKQVGSDDDQSLGDNVACQDIASSTSSSSVELNFEDNMTLLLEQTIEINVNQEEVAGDTEHDTQNHNEGASSSYTQEIITSDQEHEDSDDFEAEFEQLYLSEFPPDMTCPVCLAIPKNQIFCCKCCDQMICDECLPQLNSCPMCRTDFRADPPKRSFTAEKLMAVALKEKKTK